MCQLVLFVVPVLQRDENAQVVRSCHNPHTGASKLCAQLVISSCADASLRAVDVKGGNGRMVGGLFGEVRDCDSLAVAGHAIGAAGRSRGWCLHDGMCVFNFPVALEELACHSEIGRLAYSEELAQN